jgi:hypothetical protein
VKKNKDVYEHLAKVYLEPSRRSKKKSFSPKIKSIFSNNPLRVAFAIFICLVVILTVAIYRQRSITLRSKLSLILESNPTKFNYDFTKAQKETVTFDLKNINLSGYKTLGFRVRKSNQRDYLHMSVEFVSDFQERSKIYIKQIPTRWQSFNLPLVEFENITNWSRMHQLLFILEEWNAQIKKGSVYIDNIRFLKS